MTSSTTDRLIVYVSKLTEEQRNEMDINPVHWQKMATYFGTRVDDDSEVATNASAGTIELEMLSALLESDETCIEQKAAAMCCKKDTV